MNEYAIEILEEEKAYQKREVEWERDQEEFNDKLPLDKKGFVKNYRLVELHVSQLQQAIDQLSNSGEVIAEGRMCLKDRIPCYYVGDKSLIKIMQDIKDDYMGKKVKIILEVKDE